MPKSQKRKKSSGKHQSRFCKRTDCYYNDGKFQCTTGNRVENKRMHCIFFTKKEDEDEI